MIHLHQKSVQLFIKDNFLLKELDKNAQNL